jgi:hypothetical protein
MFWGTDGCVSGVGGRCRGGLVDVEWLWFWFWFYLTCSLSFSDGRSGRRQSGNLKMEAQRARLGGGRGPVLALPLLGWRGTRGKAGSPAQLDVAKFSTACIVGGAEQLRSLRRTGCLSVSLSLCLVHGLMFTCKRIDGSSIVVTTGSLYAVPEPCVTSTFVDSIAVPSAARDRSVSTRLQ